MNSANTAKRTRSPMQWALAVSIAAAGIMAVGVVIYLVLFLFLGWSG